MHYVIDGYNLFFKIQNQINPLEEKRENFVHALNREVQALNLNVTIVFDSQKSNAPAFPSKKELEALATQASIAKDEAATYKLDQDTGRVAMDPNQMAFRLLEGITKAQANAAVLSGKPFGGSPVEYIDETVAKMFSTKRAINEERDAMQAIIDAPLPPKEQVALVCQHVMEQYLGKVPEFQRSKIH